MEHLTKQQIVLLTLLVSFVSSIATGIVTVSLLDHAPPVITETISRVVERTIEKAAPSATTTRETVVVTDYQAVVDAITKSLRAAVKIESNGAYIGHGIIVTNTGKIIAKIDQAYVAGLRAVLDGGNVVDVSFISRDPASGLAVLQAEQSPDPRKARAYAAAAFAGSETLKLGQTVVAIAIAEAPVVGTGIISSLHHDANAPPGSKPGVSRIVTTIREKTFDSQAILVNLLGEVIGLKYGTTPEEGFTPSNIIKTYATL